MPKRTRRATMNISVPASLKTWIDRKVQQGDYGTASEFIRAVLRDAKADQEDLERTLEQIMHQPPRRRARTDSRQDRARRNALIDEIDRKLIASEASGPAFTPTKKDWDALMRRARARADSIRRERAGRRKSA